MQMVTERIHWCASDDERSLLAWAADRACAVSRHLAPVAAVGRLPDGRLVVEVTRPTGTPLASALDTLGTPTTGVAVTLTVPLLELASADRSGAVCLGTAGLDDVLVDDAGAVLLCDRPPGAAAVTPGTATPGTATRGTATRGIAARGTATRGTATRGIAARGIAARGTATPGTAAPGSATPGTATPGTASSGIATPNTAHDPGHRRSDQDGARILLLAARVVWERTDDRDPARPTVDAALAEALDGDVDAVRAALARVRAVAAPRPVRWEPVQLDLLVGVPARSTPQVWTLLGTVQEIVEHGIPLGSGRRLPLRRALVGAVIASGLTAAAVFAL
ncbi:hypothetical protein EDF64_109128 [Curtobacterium flaccumfaciens]|uniref:Uncharacterized protein n=1 Tax=Curtobacterium flaccumfaciens TaxID=2035 RepID=A0A4R6DG30_9MICO|nr:hypothetical protein [Curtobacterium flaccumfaciens]TDN43204.1 hypothetical protein EDF64_109128 [Curtobacterium flaccumfaciens]